LPETAVLVCFLGSRPPTPTRVTEVELLPTATAWRGGKICSFADSTSYWTPVPALRDPSFHSPDSDRVSARLVGTWLDLHPLWPPLFSSGKPPGAGGGRLVDGARIGILLSGDAGSARQRG